MNLLNLIGLFHKDINSRGIPLKCSWWICHFNLDYLSAVHTHLLFCKCKLLTFTVCLFIYLPSKTLWRIHNGCILDMELIPDTRQDLTHNLSIIDYSLTCRMNSISAASHDSPFLFFIPSSLDLQRHLWYSSCITLLKGFVLVSLKLMSHWKEIVVLSGWLRWQLSLDNCHCYSAI